MHYLVVKKGVYIQAVFGPLHTPTLAKANAQELAAADVDSYHEWNVCSVSIRGGLEGEPLASYRKNDNRHGCPHQEALVENRKRRESKAKPTGAPDAALVAKCGCPMVCRQVGEDPITLHVVGCETWAREQQAEYGRRPLR